MDAVEPVPMDASTRPCATPDAICLLSSSRWRPSRTEGQISGTAMSADPRDDTRGVIDTRYSGPVGLDTDATS